jgi:hypothetical protein
MRHRLPFLALLLLMGATTIVLAIAAEATPPPAPSQPVTTARVGGSPADMIFRDAQQRTATDYRAARVACQQGPKDERSNCYKAAKDTLKQERLAAKAAHDAKQ